ncbi:hypothetical protein BJ138DRAFT_1125035 [Hygrophoropsis aurantiaca]|uniref:Uncharacterized protein n=1 Tax=Hygrophoropsis aurantiaca TaxID=72124 RepID=A0ACB8AIX9_9AGAM|nr:hypothetical protein BJ138DRAFT_1125035 [Hygrophoropsis aurantiaca]
MKAFAMRVNWQIFSMSIVMFLVGFASGRYYLSLSILMSAVILQAQEAFSTIEPFVEPGIQAIEKYQQYAKTARKIGAQFGWDISIPLITPNPLASVREKKLIQARNLINQAEITISALPVIQPPEIVLVNPNHSIRQTSPNISTAEPLAGRTGGRRHMLVGSESLASAHWSDYTPSFPVQSGITNLGRVMASHVSQPL